MRNHHRRSRRLDLYLFLMAFCCGLAVAPACLGAPVYKLLKSFGNPDGMGTNPTSTPIQASDGMVYGTTYTGGRNKSGVIYRVHPDGSGYQVIYHFGPPAPQGDFTTNRPVFPVGRLLEAGNGRLYGVALSNIYGGAVFSLEKSGADFRAIKTYPTTGQQPSTPVGGLIQGTDGLLYGSTSDGGTLKGTIFRMNPDGGGYQVLYTMGRTAGSPQGSFNPLFEGSDGLLYGTSRNGGATDNGSVFRLGRDGAAFQVIHSFTSAGGGVYSPWGGVIEGADGLLYGTLEYGGVYRMARDGSGFSMVHQITNAAVGDLRRLRGELVQTPDGFLYGVAQETVTDNFQPAPGGVFRVRGDGAGFEVVARFAAVALALEYPETGLTLARDGALLGVSGGWYDNLYPGFFYRLAPESRALSIPHRFSASGGDPALPGSIREASDGRFYGAAFTNDFNNDFFSLRRDGQDTRVLYRYSGATQDERPASSELFEGMDGRFYASAHMGGIEKAGSVTRIDATGANFTRLHSFSQTSENSPANPFGGVIQARDGFLYGTTSVGGQFRYGTLFRMAADGSGWTVIHDFTPLDNPNLFNHPVNQLLEGSDGSLHGLTNFGCYRINKDGTGYRFTELPRSGGNPPLPRGPFIEGSDGALYGATSQGGAAGLGSVFKINADGGGLTVLHECTATAGAPYQPAGSLAEGTDGKIYGVTYFGGARGSNGALFSLNRDGTGFTRVYSFGVSGDGINPVALARSGDGLLYGVTQHGGAYGFGTFFRYGEAPEIGVEQPDGTALSSGAGQIGFGEVKVGTARTLELTIKNSGELPLGPVLGAVDGPQAAGFTAADMVPGTIGPGASGVLKVTFSPGAAGARSATLRIGSNDFDENPFVVALAGTGVAPDITVHDGPSAAGPELSDGQTEPVNFGVVRVVGQAERRISIANTGNAPLLITSITAPQGFTVQLPRELPATLAVNESLVAGLRFEAGTPGVFTGTLSIVSDDPDEPSFDFPVSGEGVSPEITVHQGPDTAAPELVSGQTQTVEFGRIVQGSPGSKALTVANTGSAPLAVASISVPAGYELASASAATIAPGASASWEIRLTSPVVGPHAGSVVIISDDLDEPRFSFPVHGEVYIPDPAVTPPNQETTLNRQTGLREQTVRISNDTTATVPAYRLLIRGLPGGVTVAGATEARADGTVVVLVRQPLAPFSSISLVLEYASATRQPLTVAPLISTEVVLEPPTDSAGEPGGTLSIERAAWLPETKGFLLEFTSSPGRLYSVEYSDDGAVWKTSSAPVRGSGNRTQWIDRGPPRTASPPSSQTLRLYRIRTLAE